MYNSKLLCLFEASIKSYMTAGFVQIEDMKEETDERLEDIYT